MPTDAEILREVAESGDCDPYYGYIVPVYAFGVEKTTGTDSRAAYMVDAVARDVFTRAADAIEENARLRAQVAELEAEIERRDDNDFNAMVEASLAD